MHFGFVGFTQITKQLLNNSESENDENMSSAEGDGLTIVAYKKSMLAFRKRRNRRGNVCVITEVYSERSQTSKMIFFAKTVNG